MDFLVSVVDSIVQSPLFKLTAFVVSAFGLIMRFEAPRNWFEDRIRWTASRGRLWHVMLVLGGLALIIVAADQYGAIAAIAVGEALLLTALVPVIITQNERQAEIARLGDLVNHIVDIHRIPYHLNYYKITYSISSDGSVHTLEELGINPEWGAVYFRNAHYGLHPMTEGESDIGSLVARNKGSDDHLEIVELSRGKRRLEYLVVLDPPALPDNPSEIEIECVRTGVFVPLVTNLKHRGRIQILRESKHATVEFIAPRELELTGFSGTDEQGIYAITRRGDRSAAVWSASDLTGGSYGFFLEANAR